MRCLLGLLICLSCPALATPCLDAGVIEMAAAVGGTGSWQAVVQAHRAALAAGCDSPVIGLNIARAQRRIAQEDDAPGPTCAAVDAYRAVVDRGEPAEFMSVARPRMDELSALCAARRARAGVLADEGADSCGAMALYDELRTRRPPLTLRVDLDAEAAPLRRRCARRLHDEARALDDRPDRVSACAAFQRYRAYRRVAVEAEGDAVALESARRRCGEVPSAAPRWLVGPRLLGGFGWHLGEPAPQQEVEPALQLGGDAVIERRDAVGVRARLGYRYGSAHLEDRLIDQTIAWRWHTLAAGLGARLDLVAGLDLAADLGVEVLLDAREESDGPSPRADALFEPVVITGELGAGWRAGPLRVELLAGLDLGPRTAVGDAGGRLGRVMLALSWLFGVR